MLGRKFSGNPTITQSVEPQFFAFFARRTDARGETEPCAKIVEYPRDASTLPERVTPVSTSTSGEYRKRVYTKFGDKGETSLLYGGRISKNNPHTEAYGITDEAVSAMGLARAMSSDDRVKELLRNLQSELFTVAAELATDPDKYDLFQQHFSPVTPEMVENLENAIDSLEQDMTMPTVFILPGGSPASAAMDLARCIIRTAERRVVAMGEAGLLTNGLLVSYLNRLGDLLFVVARYEDRDLPIERATGQRT